MIVALRRMMLEVPMMVMIVVGVRRNGDRVVRCSRLMDRGRSISLIVIAIVIVIDDQMPASGSMLVGGRSTNRGCFRGCILHGTHRTYDQRYGSSFLPVSFTKPCGIYSGGPVSTPRLPLFFSFQMAPVAGRRSTVAAIASILRATISRTFSFSSLPSSSLRFTLLYTARPRKRARARSER